MEAITHLGWEGWFSLAIVVLCFGLFAFSRAAPDVVTSGALTLLLVFGIVTPAEALAGFFNAGMLTVGVLYVVVTGLTETGAAGWIGQRLLGQPRGPTDARLRLMLPVAGLSAFLNNTPVVAIFIPAVQDWAKRHRLELSRLLIPLSYASIVGGTCTLIGTSTNLVVNGLYVERVGGTGFALFAPAWVGLPVTLAAILFMLIAGHWLLPRRPPAAASYEDVRQYTAGKSPAEGSPLKCVPDDKTNPPARILATTPQSRAAPRTHRIETPIHCASRPGHVWPVFLIVRSERRSVGGWD